MLWLNKRFLRYLYNIQCLRV